MKNITNETEYANFDSSIEIDNTIDLESLFLEIEQIKENQKASKTTVILEDNNGVYCPQQDWDLSEIFGENNELTQEELTAWMLEN